MTSSYAAWTMITFLTMMSGNTYQVHGQCAITNAAISLSREEAHLTDPNNLELVIDGTTTGAEATSVTWRRNGVMVDRYTQPLGSFYDGGGENIVSTGPCESQMYRVALAVIGYLPGNYTYTVSNENTTIPLTSPVFQIQDPDPPTNLILAQVNHKRVQATWTPPINFPQATYVVYMYINSVIMNIRGIAATGPTFTTYLFTTNSNVTIHVRSTTGTYLSIPIFSILTIKDVSPPKISVSSMSTTSADLSFTQTTDSLSVDIYTVTLTSTICVGVPIITQSSTRNTITVLNLMAGIHYIVSVTATNNAARLTGTGTTSLTTMVTDPSGSPAAPVVNIIFSTNVSISWTEINCLKRNGAITNYIIQYRENFSRDVSIITHSNYTKHTINGLKPFTQYTFRVAGFNGMGTGPFSNATRVIRTAEDTPVGSPGVPTASVIMSTNITLSWTPIYSPDQNGEISSYVIQYGDRIIDTQSNATTYLVTGLKPFTLYSFSVAGVNVVNTGPFSAASAVIRTAEDRPSEVRNFQLTASLFSIWISWEEPQPLNGVLVHYSIQYSVNGTQKLLWTSNLTSILISNLRPDQLVSNITVTATTGGGEGPSVMADISTLDRPAKVQDIRVDFFNGTSVRVSWNITGFQDVSEFIVFYREAGNSDNRISVPSSSSSVIFKVVAGKQYVIEVSAMVLIDGHPLFGHRSIYGSVAVQPQEYRKITTFHESVDYTIAVVVSVVVTFALLLAVLGRVLFFVKKIYNTKTSNEIETKECDAYNRQHEETEPEGLYDTVNNGAVE